MTSRWLRCTAVTDGASDERTTRDRLLDAGVEIVQEHFAAVGERIGAGFQFVSPTEVARRAGVSKGMLYHCWGGHDGSAFDRYLTDLAARTLEQMAQPEVLRHEAERLRDAGVGLDAVVKLLAGIELTSVVDEPERRLSLLQSLTWITYSANTAIAAALNEANDRTYASLADMYDVVLPVFGRRMRAARDRRAGRPLDTGDLARALSCVTDGFAGEALHDRRVLDADISWPIDGTDEPTTLYAICLMSVVTALTEPVPT